MDLAHIRLFDGSSGRLLYKDPYLFTMAGIDFVNVSQQVDAGKPSAAIADSDMLYWANARGVFAGEMKPGVLAR